MRAKPPSVPSALARREAARSLLAGAVDCRDAQAVLSFTGQWVHRQGMASLPALMAELAQGETLLWWQQLLQQPSQSGGLAPLQAPPAPGPQAPDLLAHRDPAPSPPLPSPLASGPAAWTDPNQQGSKAAEIPTVELKPEEAQAVEGQPLEGKPGAPNPKELNPVAVSEAPAPAPMQAQTPAPTAVKAPLALATAAAAAPRPVAAPVRRGAGTSRPAPAPRNPELARLRAWLPDNDGLGSSSRRSHAA